jgi:hypothetical protein
MSKAETAEERAAYTEKFFNCAESIIQEWVAEFFDKPTVELFPDYQTESDVIGFMIDSKQYTAYLVTMPCDTENLVDMELLNKQDKARKACSMLFDAVREVFMAVTGALAESRTTLEPTITPSTASELDKNMIAGLMPVFDENKMAFHLVRVNRKAMQLQAAQTQRAQIIKFLQEAKEGEISDEQQESISSGLVELGKVFTSITKEALDAEEALCNTINEKIKEKTWLHIVLEEADPDDADILNSSMKRLPMFGLQFQDPEEENYVDKLKKGLYQA